MSRFGMTGKIAAKADRNRDAFEYIDDIRQEVVEINEWREATDREIQGLKNKLAEKRDWSESGVWRVVKEKLEEETVDWVKWGIRAAFCGFGTAMLAGLGWMIVRILHS